MKNFKLLLATTAILSTGIAMGVWADDPAPTFSHPSLEIKAEAFFVKSISVNSEPIYFGVIDPSAGGYVTVDKDTGEATGTAKFLTNYQTTYGIIRVSNVSAVGAWMSGFDDDAIDLVLDGKTFNLYEEGATEDELHRCGTVRDLERTAATYDGDSKKIVFKVGGTLDVNKNYIPSATTGNLCSGKVEVTYVFKAV